jgi:hypothetical protein
MLQLKNLLKNKLTFSSRTLCYSLIALQVLDGILTAYAVNKYGVGIEGNPLIRFLITQLGLWSLGFVKLIAIGFLVFILRNVKGLNSFEFNTLLYVIFVLYFITVVILWPYCLVLSSV